MTPDVSNLDNSKVTSMGSMFYNMSSVTTPPIVTNLDTRSVTGMSSMFANMSSLTVPPDVSNFDTSSVTNMSGMFRDMSALAIGLIGIENFDVTSLTTAHGFLKGSTLTTEAYDVILINWSKQDVQLNVAIDFGNSNYTLDGEAEVARGILIGKGWVITDSGGM